MPSQTKITSFADYQLLVSEHVYDPAEDSFLLAENLAVKRGDYVLDMGTGCGILAVVAAEKASKVVAVDISPYAVRCAKENAKANHVAGKTSVVQGDLFTPIRTAEEFDLILFNAPYLPSTNIQEGSWLERAWAGGKGGRQVIDRFVCESPKYLKKGGSILLMQSTLSDVHETLHRFRRRGLEADILAKRALPFFETIVLVKAKQLS
jgi:release factor glutamine methyltransferase